MTAAKPRAGIYVTDADMAVQLATLGEWVACLNAFVAQAGYPLIQAVRNRELQAVGI